jgi:hypothetical protein
VEKVGDKLVAKMEEAVQVVGGLVAEDQAEVVQGEHSQILKHPTPVRNLMGP